MRFLKDILSCFYIREMLYIYTAVFSPEYFIPICVYAHETMILCSPPSASFPQLCLYALRVLEQNMWTFKVSLCMPCLPMEEARGSVAKQRRGHGFIHVNWQCGFKLTFEKCPRMITNERQFWLNNICFLLYFREKKKRKKEKIFECFILRDKQ